MRIFLIIWIVFSTTKLFGQLTAQQTTQLKQEILTKINALRKEQKLNELKTDRILESAAIYHSNYMAANQILRHNEKNVKDATPKKRVENAGGLDFELVGENILSSTPQTFPLNAAGISKLANEMFEGWKKSPPHYKNMTNPAYTLADFGFCVDPKTNVVYATNVFGKKGIRISNQLSKNDFGLKKAPEDCKKDFDSFINLVYNLGGGLTIKDNQVILYASNLETIKRIIINENDGFAVDLIERGQYPCNAPNRLDMSPIYDGVLLKPIYKQAIFDGNEAQSDYRLIIELGEVPAHMRGKDLDVRLLLIRNKLVCLQINQGEVPSDRYSLTQVEPIIYEPQESKFNYDGIIKSEELSFQFNPRDSIPITIPKFNPEGKRVHSVYIQSYSSIDGDSLSNAYYHYMRGKWIERYILKSCPVQQSQIKLDFKENWELMEFQMRYHYADDLLILPHDSIRKSYKYYEGIPWKKLFAEQRKSSATINYYGKLPQNATSIQLARLNLPTALINKDWELANKCLAVYYKHKEFPLIILTNPFFEIIKNEPALVQNVAAIYCQNGILDLTSETQFLFAALQHGSKLSIQAKENLAVLYGKLSYDLLEDWDLPAQQLANVIKPENVLKVIQGVTFRPEVMVNVHLTFIDYYGQINDSKNINTSFDFISNYYKNKIMRLEDEIQLCLFFNRWSMYQLTIEHLLPKFKAKTLNVYGTFLLAKTMTFYPLSDKNEANAVIMEASKYKQEWCKWIKDEFSLLESDDVKKVFCKTCVK